jgi:hypothetical protein
MVVSRQRFEAQRPSYPTRLRHHGLTLSDCPYPFPYLLLQSRPTDFLLQRHFLKNFPSICVAVSTAAIRGNFSCLNDRSGKVVARSDKFGLRHRRNHLLESAEHSLNLQRVVQIFGTDFGCRWAFIQSQMKRRRFLSFAAMIRGMILQHHQCLHLRSAPYRSDHHLCRPHQLLLTRATHLKSPVSLLHYLHSKSCVPSRN